MRFGLSLLLALYACGTQGVGSDSGAPDSSLDTSLADTSLGDSSGGDASTDANDDGPPPPPGLANLWIVANGDAPGSCARSATLVAYAQATSCPGTDAALAKASAGDTIRFPCGTYPAQVMHDTPARPLTPHVTVTSDTNVKSCANIASVTLGSNNGVPGGNPPGGIDITYLSMGSFEAVSLCSRPSGTCPREVNIRHNDIAVNAGFDDGTSAIVSLGAMQTGTFQYNQIGPSCCTGVGNIVMSPDNSNPSNTQQPTNVDIGHNLVVNNARFCSDWYTGSTCPGSSDVSGQHMDCVHIYGGVNLSIHDNELVDCDVQGIFLESVNGGIWKNVTVANNLIGLNGTANTCISVHPNSGSNNVFGAFDFLFNTCESSGIRFEGFDQATFASGAAVKYVGNLGGAIGMNSTSGDCTGGVTGVFEYDYNRFANAACSGTDAIVSPPFVSNVKAPKPGQNLRLASPSGADNAVPVAFCTPYVTADIDGNPRPDSFTNCEAGASERK